MKNLLFKSISVLFFAVLLIGATPPDLDNPDIFWPENVNLFYDGTVPLNEFIYPDNIAPPFDRPKFLSNPPSGCSQAYSTSWSDTHFTEHGEAFCTKIFRKWSVMNWCTGEQWMYTQIIMILNVEEFPENPCED